MIKGMPLSGTIRLITKKEHALLKGYGIKRTYYIANEYNGENGFCMFRKIGDEYLYYPAGIQHKLFEILVKFWGVLNETNDGEKHA